MTRYNTKKISIGSVQIGGGEPIRIQSMTNTPTQDVARTVTQILQLEEAGCEIIRVAVPDMDVACAIADIQKQIHIPLVADIHFDYRLAIEAIKQGADKIRMNPGNIGGKEEIAQVVEAAKERTVPIRVGVNGGSLEKEYLQKYGKVTAQGLVDSALSKIQMIEDCGYDQLVVSIKSSDVALSIAAHELLAKRTPYPIHVGITESGTLMSGSIKSAVGLGVILHQGIGDTIRVSLTSDPVNEIVVAKQILHALDLRKSGIEVISCPTCGRTRIDLIPLAASVEAMAREVEKQHKLTKPLKIAVMGCAVNGPGEAKEADLGIAGGLGEALLFKKGEIIRKVPEAEVLDTLQEVLLETIHIS
jgi:(E)-4-hydroxy-3-methylbut-2-enyl-diphosphate synthase